MVQTQRESSKELHGETFHNFSDRFLESDLGDDSYTFQRFSNLGDIGDSDRNICAKGKGRRKNTGGDSGIAASSDETTAVETDCPSSSMENSSQEFSTDTNEHVARLTSEETTPKGNISIVVKGNLDRGPRTARAASPSVSSRSTDRGSKRQTNVATTTVPSSSSGQGQPTTFRPSKESPARVFSSLPMAPFLDSSSHHDGRQSNFRASGSNDYRAPSRRGRREESNQQSQQVSDRPERSTSRRSTRRSRSVGTSSEISARLRSRSNRNKSRSDPGGTSDVPPKTPSLSSSDRAARRAARKEQMKEKNNSAAAEANEKSLNTKRLPPRKNLSPASVRSNSTSKREGSIEPASRRTRERSLDARPPRNHREGSVEPGTRKARDRSADRRREGLADVSTVPRTRERSASGRESRGRSSSTSRHPPRAMTRERLSSSEHTNNSHHASPMHSRSDHGTAGRGARKDTVLGSSLASSSGPPNRSSSIGASRDKHQLRAKSHGVFRNSRNLKASSNHDRLQALGRILGDSSHHEKQEEDDNNPLKSSQIEKGLPEDENDSNLFAGLLTSNLTGKKLRQVLRDQNAKRVECTEENGEKTATVETSKGRGRTLCSPVKFSENTEVLTGIPIRPALCTIQDQKDPSPTPKRGGSVPYGQLKEKGKQEWRQTMDPGPTNAITELPPAYSSMRPPTTPVAATGGQRRFQRASSMGSTAGSPSHSDRRSESPSRALSSGSSHSHGGGRRHSMDTVLKRSRSRERRTAPACQLRVQERGNAAPLRRGRSSETTAGDDGALPPAFRARSPRSIQKEKREEIKRKATSKHNRKENVRNSTFSILDGDS